MYELVMKNSMFNLFLLQTWNIWLYSTGRIHTFG